MVNTSKPKPVRNEVVILQDIVHLLVTEYPNQTTTDKDIIVGKVVSKLNLVIADLRKQGRHLMGNTHTAYSPRRFPRPRKNRGIQ